MTLATIGSATADPTATPGRLRALLTVLCAALALVVAGNSALATALPDIARDLGADQAELTWVVDAYALTFAALLLTAGLAADRVGRRSLLIFGLAIFGVASVASAFSPDPVWFITLRAAAGVGAAAIFPVTLSALVDAYPLERRAFAIGVWSGVSSVGAVAGTLVAGGLLEVFWWGSVQLAFGLIALAIIVPAAVLVAQNRNPSLSVDPLGAVWSIVALAGLVFAVIEGPQRGWFDVITLLSFAAGAVGCAGFAIHQLRSRAPSLDVRLFTNRGLSAGSIIVAVQFFASLGLFVLAPQYLQFVRSYTPLGSAVTLLVIPVGVGAGIGLSGALTRRSGPRLPGVLGLASMGVAFAALAFALPPDRRASEWLLVAGLVVFGLGFGLGVTPGTQLIIDGLPAERRSVASAVNDLTREVGGVIGIAVLSSVLLSSYRSNIETALVGLPPEVGEAVNAGAGAAISISTTLGPNGQTLADAARDAFAQGFSASMWIGAGVLLAAAVVVAIVAPANVSRRPDVPNRRSD